MTLRVLTAKLLTPVVLASIIWLPAVAISSFWTQLITVCIAVPVVSVAASRNDHLWRPDLVDHLRQSSLLYVFAIAIFPHIPGEIRIIGYEGDRVMVASDYPRALFYLFVAGIVLNVAALVFWREVQRDANVAA